MGLSRVSYCEITPCPAFSLCSDLAAFGQVCKDALRRSPENLGCQAKSSERLAHSWMPGYCYMSVVEGMSVLALFEKILARLWRSS